MGKLTDGGKEREVPIGQIKQEDWDRVFGKKDDKPVAPEKKE